MNTNLRWNLVLGCALIAALEVPQGLTLLLQDLGGPYTETVDTAPTSTAHIDHARARAEPGERAPARARPGERGPALASISERGPALVTLAQPWLAVPTVWSDLRGTRFDLERSTTALALGR